MREIVIKISDDWEEKIKQLSDSEIASYLYCVLRNGIPLPKGHGRLIDVTKVYTSSFKVHEVLAKAPAIIEADKGN